MKFKLINSSRYIFFLLTLILVSYIWVSNLDELVGTKDVIPKCVILLLLSLIISAMIISLFGLVETLFFKFDLLEYKEGIYDTRLKKSYSSVDIYKVSLYGLHYKKIASIDDTDNKKEYQSNLKFQLETYIRKDIETKLKNRKNKNKFKDFNKVQ